MKKWVKIDKSAPSARADFIRQWLLRLIDPAAKQTKQRLLRLDGSACCLGVACDLAKLKKEKYEDECYSFTADQETMAMPMVLTEFLNLFTDVGNLFWLKAGKNKAGKIMNSLAELNDNGWSFLRIARLIQTHPEAIFQDLKSAEKQYILATVIPTQRVYNEQKRRLHNSFRVETETPQNKNSEA